MIHSDSVVPLPLSRLRVTEIVREIAAISARWSINVTFEDTAEWRRLVNRRQVERCLQDGEVLEERATLDEYGYWRFRMSRVCGGLSVVIEVAIEHGPAIPKLFVIGVKGDQI
jgi:hypothetical protein